MSESNEQEPVESNDLVPLTPQPTKPKKIRKTFPGLNKKHLIFCEEYVICDVAVQAWFVAYGKFKPLQDGETEPQPWSYQYAKMRASLLLKKPAIRKEIRAIRKSIQRKAAATIKRLNEVDSHAAFLDVRRFVKANPDGSGRMLQPHELPPDLARCIKKIKAKSRKVKQDGDSIETIEEVEYDFIDAMKAREAIAKRLGIDKPQTPIEQLVEYLSPELRAKVWAELAPVIKRESD